MVTTPEGKIKARIRKVLDKRGELVYTFMPVQSGYGVTSIDYLVCADGLFIGIEAKRPGGKLTARQEMALENIRKAGGTTFVIDDEDDIEALDIFLRRMLLKTSAA